MKPARTKPAAVKPIPVKPGPVRDVNEICRDHLQAALKEAGRNVSSDLLGRAMLGEVVAMWRRDRSLDDIKTELEYTADNIDPDEEYAFMRP